MATRSERFRSEEERARARDTHPAKADAQPVIRRAEKQERERALVSGTVHPEGGAVRNLARGTKSAYALEQTVGSPTPSRKSTRRSAGTHLKAATQLTARHKAATASPAVRHIRGR
jgi:hypothetical protein